MTHPEQAPAPRGVWLGASLRLGYPVPAGRADEYPHVCAAGAQRRDCAACGHTRQRGEVALWDE